MAAHEYAFTLTPGNSSRTRSTTIACAAIAAVCVLSSAVVMRELAGAPTARAATATTAIPAAPIVATVTPAAPIVAPATPAAPAITTAPPSTPAQTWTLEPRWWPGAVSQIKRAAPAVLDSELTFTKGYQLRLAARQATQPAAQTLSAPAQLLQPASAQVAVGPTVENQNARTAPRKAATTTAQTETLIVRRINATQAEPYADPFVRFNVGTRALSYDEQRPSERGFVYRSAPSRGLFGTLY